MNEKRRTGTNPGAALLTVLLVISLAGSAALAFQGYGQPASRSRYDQVVFYDPSFSDDLDGYGEWEYVSSVGATLWFPFVDVTWRPYLHGHWIHTTHGMTWVAYEPWGFIPHHYGRWIIVDGYGWGWVPGYEYGPAWVSWGVVDGYVGWAPVPPVWYRYARHRTYRYQSPPVRYGYGGSFRYHASGIDFSLWVFVPTRYACYSDAYIHALPTGRSVEFFRGGRVLPIGGGLDVRYVREVTHREIPTVPVHRKKYRLGNRTVTYYRPEGQEKRIRGARSRMEKTVSYAPERSRRAKPPSVGAGRRSGPGRSPAHRSIDSKSENRYERGGSGGGSARGNEKAIRRADRSKERKHSVRPKSEGRSKSAEKSQVSKRRPGSERERAKINRGGKSGSGSKRTESSKKKRR